jgi:hypothetical protein
VPEPPTVAPTEAPIVIQSAPTEPPPIVVELIIERVEVQRLVIVATPTEGPGLQEITLQEGDEEIGPALLREAMDQ